jgi:hypothetical protein
MAFQRPQSGIVLLLPVLLLQMFSFAFPKFIITNFALPSYVIIHLFQDQSRPLNDYDAFRDWSTWPEIFVLPVPPVLLSLGLQLVIGIFLWRAVVRKTTNPFQPLLLRWEATAIFALLAMVQHGLIWGIWHGRFPTAFASNDRFSQPDSMLSIVHGGTILVGVLILTFASPLPERVRVEALRSGAGNLQLVFSRSAVSLALALVAVAAAASLPQFIFSSGQAWKAWALAVGNLFVFFMMFSLLLEYCRLRFKRRALGFVALWLFVLCLLPFVLAGVFSSEVIAKLSFLAPGTVALNGADGDDMKYLVGWTGIHLVVVSLLFIEWSRQWRLLLTTSSSLSRKS